MLLGSLRSLKGVVVPPRHQRPLFETVYIHHPGAQYTEVALINDVVRSIGNGHGAEILLRWAGGAEHAAVGGFGIRPAGIG